MLLNLCLFGVVGLRPLDFVCGDFRLSDRGRRSVITIDFGQELPSVGLTAQFEHFTVHIVEVLLLGSQDRARSRYPDPANERGRREPEVLHAVQTDKRSSSAQTCLTMNRNCTLFVFCRSQELRNNFIWRCSSIKEI